MNARQLRLVRAAAVSSVATLIAAVSHTLGGGSAPAPLLILAVTTLLTPLSALLVGARRSRGRVALAVLIAQGAFHVVFQVLGSPSGSGAASALGHSHHVDLSLLGPASAATAPGALMLLAHAVAAVLTTLLVWHGEGLLRAVARWVEALLLRAVAFASSDHPRPRPLRSLPLLSIDAAVAAAVSRRGPPPLARD